MKYKEFEGKTIDEAIASAIKGLGVSFEDLDIQVISEGAKGMFGIMGNKNATILAAKKTDSSETQDDKNTEETQEDILEHAKEMLREILYLMSIEAKVLILEDSDLEIIGNGSGLIIGKQGQTLDALQLIINKIINKDREQPVHITIDSEAYRKRHVEHLKNVAIKMGQKVKRTGEDVSLEKMNPYERRIIHLALKDDSDIDTKSIGEGVYKKVVISPKKELQ
jgi:spoIIIJ-associated protein